MLARARLALSVVVLVLFAVAPLSAQEKSNFFDSDGIKIHYTVKGQGEPVVLIHGFAASATLNWKAPGVYDALSKNYQVIALDNRGHGVSAKPHDPKAYGEIMVEDVVRLLDHLKIEKAHVVGYSMGAFITNKLITEHPDRVISATLGGAGWMRADDERGSVLLELAKSLETGGGIKPLILALNPPDRPLPSDQQIELTNRMLLFSNDAKALAAVARGMAGLSVTEEELKENEVPVQAVIGEIDPLKAGVDEMKQVVPDLPVVVIEGANHMTAFTAPAFLKAVQAFLADHSRQPVAAGK